MERIGSDSTRSPLIRGAAGAPGPEVPGLREGASILFKALAPSSEGRWTVLVRGVRLDAAVAAPLNPGSLYSARAERQRDGAGWVLRVLGPAGEGRAAEFLRSSGLPGDAASILVLRALMAEGLPLEPRRISELRAALLRKDVSEERAALLARALAKALDPGAYVDAVDALSSRGEGDGFGDRETGGGRDEGSGSRQAPGEGRTDGGAGDGSAGSNRQGSGGDPGGVGAGEASAPIWTEFLGSEGDDPEGLGALTGLLKALAGRTGDKPDPRQVFNSRSGPRGRWIYVPYRFEREGVAFSGTLRILVSQGNRFGSILSADVEVRGPGRFGRYDFDLRGSEGGLRLGIADRSEGSPRLLVDSLGDLERRLAGRVCRVEILETRDLGPEYPAVDDHA